jgi:hypothetical protein
LHWREQELAVILQLECEPHDDNVEALVMLVKGIERHGRVGREVAKFHIRCAIS